MRGVSNSHGIGIWDSLTVAVLYDTVLNNGVKFAKQA